MPRVNDISGQRNGMNPIQEEWPSPIWRRRTSWALQSNASSLPDIVQRTNGTNLDYATPETTSPSLQQRVNAFVPSSVPTPPNGWPVLITNSGGGSNNTVPLSTLDKSVHITEWIALNNGVAVVAVGTTGTSSIWTGSGVWYDSSTTQYADYNQPADYKDMEQAIQWVKTQEMFSADENQIYVLANSGGARAFAWSALGPNRARSSGSAQARTNTRVAGAIFNRPTNIWNAGYVLSSTLGTQFPNEAGNDVASTMDDVYTSALYHSSIFTYAFNDSEASALNTSTPVCLIYHDPRTESDLTRNSAGNPTVSGTVLENHDAWLGYMLLSGLMELDPVFHGTNSILVVNPVASLNNIESGTLPITNVDQRDAQVTASNWLLRRLGKA